VVNVLIVNAVLPAKGRAESCGDKVVALMQGFFVNGGTGRDAETAACYGAPAGAFLRKAVLYCVRYLRL
jgi:hypothetical protein